MAETIKTSASMVILPPLSEDAQHVLTAHEEEILHIFTGYALTYGAERASQLGSDNRLPLSGIEIGGATTSSMTAPFEEWLQETALRVVARSLFVANSGHDDRFASVEDLARTARSGLSLNEHAIPSFASIFAAATGSASVSNEPEEVEQGDRRSGHPRSAKLHAHSLARRQGFALNAYILDFYTHGQVQPLSDANGIRRGDVWFVLEEFDLTLKTVRGVLELLIMKKPQHVKEGEEDEMGEEAEGGESDDFDSGFISVDDPTEKDDEDADQLGTKAMGLGSAKPTWVAEKDWRVLEVVYAVTEEFNEKFKAMWA